MIYFLYLTVVLWTGEAQYRTILPIGPDLANCQQVSSNIVDDAPLPVGVKSRTWDCILQEQPK